MLRMLLLLILCCTLSSSCNYQQKKPPSIIFDGMMDLNDLYTLYLLTKSPKANLLGVTVSGSDNYYFDKAGTRAKSILLLANKPKLPVSDLLSTTFCSSATLPANWTLPVDDFEDVNLPQNPNQPLTITGSDLMYHLVKNSKEKVTLFCCGPLNNVANLVATYPELIPKIERVIILAGALHTTESVTLPNNLHWEEASSYNIYIDPCAARIVLAAKIPVTLIPLSVVTLVSNDEVTFNRYAKKPTSAGAEFVLQVLKNHWKTNSILSFATFWDAIGMMSIIEPNLLTLQKISINILTEGFDNFGHILEVPEGSSSTEAYSVDLCTFVDEDMFYKTLFDMIN